MRAGARTGAPLAQRVHHGSGRRGGAAIVFALAALGLAAPARAQDASAGDLGLRPDPFLSSAANPSLDAQAASQTPPGPDSLINPQTPPARPKPSDKTGTKSRTPPPQPPGALPALQPYRNAQRLGLKGGPPDLEDGRTPPPTVAAIPAPPSRPARPPVDDKPFDPTGVMVGDLKLTPYVEEDGGWASNPSNLAGSQKGSFFETTEAGLGINSLWSSSSLTGDLKGGYTDYFANHSADTPYGSGALHGQYDVSKDLDFDAEGRFNVTSITAASLGLGSGVAFANPTQPLTDTAGATIGGEQKFGKFSLSLHGSLDRTTYQDALLTDGTNDLLSSDDFNDWGLRARAAYQASPEFAPFVELDADTRRYDLGADAFGYERNSDGVSALGGATLEFTHLLKGELSAGYGQREYQDPRLPMLASPLFNASLTWSATALTSVTFKATTALEDTTIPAASGAANHAYTIEVDHDLRRNLALIATAGYASDSYVGLNLHDATTNVGLAVKYSLNRDVVLKASIARQWYETNLPNANYAATVVMLGLRLQR
jgi:hypothetical protein